MSRSAVLRVAAALAALAAAFVLPAAARAQTANPDVEIRGPSGDTLGTVTPTFTIVATGFSESGCDIELTLQIATTGGFSQPIIERTTCGDSATITLARPLPEGIRIYWRARARSATADVRSVTVGPRTTPRWLTLVSPNLPNGTTVSTRRPTFVWSSPDVAEPPGPWRYELTITNVASRQSSVVAGLSDTSYTPDFDLESNTSYRWAVTARLSTGDSARVASAASFVIVDPNAPLLTLLYQNWPNPFPSAAAPRTCFWFDIARPSLVQLDVYDIRGQLVRTIIPAGDVGSEFSAGRYGRAIPGSDSGCDYRFSWDGTDQAGRVVPSGVYLVRLRADGVDSMKRMLFRGR